MLGNGEVRACYSTTFDSSKWFLIAHYLPHRLFILRVCGLHDLIPKAEVQTIVIVEIFMVHVMVGRSIQPPANARINKPLRINFIPQMPIHIVNYH